MIDTHCHLLPGLDDGPSDVADSVALARWLVRQGVSRVICTPHLSREYPVAHVDAAAALRSLRSQLEATGIDLLLDLAAEVTPERTLEEPTSALRARAIAGRFLVVEVVHHTTLISLQLVQQTLASAGLVTILAHPERCRFVQRKPDGLSSLRADGALVQIVAPSLIGRWGEDVSETAWKLLDMHMVDLLASDAHGVHRRRPHLRAAADLVTRRFGEDARIALTERAPQLLLEGVDPRQTNALRRIPTEVR